MKQAIYRFLYYRLLGWKTDVTLPEVDKCVICVAPHTSNWDLLMGKLFYGAIGRNPVYFMMKKEWFFFPLGYVFRALGGIPVDRSRKTSLVDQMSEQFARRKRFHLAITPEGTRKANADWKKGFYYIAVTAKVPVQLFAIDYTTKTITATRMFVPTGDIEKEMDEVKLYFKDFKGKKPRNFAC
ncbi:MAG: 1-acyl-sn-glycerol-3-phosphate acyltransferase [Mediterranea sp.]|jgi:1-acyl-sn-glycerol-3-phosphate acyltransferase|nr:1-acyl-sn-glycerol-3-phosphate acyltransferase [Mediterranea sp.]